VAGPADRVVARARALVGARFRMHGRGEDGLDCVGLAAAALGRPAGAGDYPLRGGSLGRLETALRTAGLKPVAAPAAGDLLVMAAGPGQLHLGIWTGAGLIHADAGLRRVVERPGPAPWPILSVWRAA
jgi:murein DD-endopeptidase / murein LD-carboxypeptidase